MNRYTIQYPDGDSLDTMYVRAGDLDEMWDKFFERVSCCEYMNITDSGAALIEREAKVIRVEKMEQKK